jgi:hypothetical protein
MIFMEDVLGETVIRFLTAGTTASVSGAACLFLILNDDIATGTPMSLLTNKSIPTGAHDRPRH